MSGVASRRIGPLIGVAMALSLGCGERDRGAGQAHAAAVAGTDRSPAPEIVLRPWKLTTPVETPGAHASLRAHVEVAGARIGPGGTLVRFFLDGRPVGPPGASPRVIFEDVPVGLRQLAAELVAADGTPVDFAGGLATVKVKVCPACTVAEDCVDDRACSRQTCVAGRCAYAEVAGCCDQDLECPVGARCEESACVSDPERGARPESGDS